MEKTGSKIIDTYYEKLKKELEQQPLDLSRVDLVKLIREIVAEEIAKIRLDEIRIEEPEFLNVREAAKFLNLAVTTLYEKTSLKLIPFHKRDKKLYFKKEELKRWLLGDPADAVVLKLPVPRKNKIAA